LAQRRRFHAAAGRLAALARRTVRRQLARGVTKRLKSDQSYVTTADLAVERALRRAITRAFPDHGIVGEEFPPLRLDSPFQWILDPIDGTLSFTHGIPFFGTLIALHYHRRPIATAIDQPALDLRYTAGLGLGAFRNGRRFQLRDLGPREDVRREVIATAERSRFANCGQAARFDRLQRTHPLVRSYADCLGHTLAAEGAVGAMVDYGIRLWDIAATELLVTEAGGRWVETYRQPRQPHDAVYGVIFGKPKVVQWLLPFFRAGDHG
jgi:fructose-1,6-bisphosphatase/inositol monophosphatase family enzyme